jgi:HEAT repeat protein
MIPAPTAITAVERMANDADGGVRAASIRALGRFGPPTESTLRLARSAFVDPDPQVRAATVSTIGVWDLPVEQMVADLIPLLQEPNDEVKVQVAEVLPRCVGSAESVVEKLSQTLAEDVSPLVQIAVALALAKLGPLASAAGPTLLRVGQTGEAGVREQAMRAMVMIQPPEAQEGFVLGLIDPVPEVRVVASAGWIKAASVPSDVAPALIQALRDPETQVRANVAFALGPVGSPANRSRSRPPGMRC